MAKDDEKDAEIAALRAALARRDAQLDTLIANIGTPVVPPMPLAMSEDDKVRMLDDQLKGKDRPKQRERRFPTTSEATGASFTIRVIESKEFPEGRIVELLDYREPAGADRNVREGGIVPDGIVIRHAGSPDTTVQYKGWRYETFHMADLRAYIGRGMSSRHLEDRAAIKLPWQTYDSYVEAPAPSP